MLLANCLDRVNPLIFRSLIQHKTAGFLNSPTGSKLRKSQNHLRIYTSLYPFRQQYRIVLFPSLPWEVLLDAGSLSHLGLDAMPDQTPRSFNEGEFVRKAALQQYPNAIVAAHIGGRDEGDVLGHAKVN